MLKKIGIIFGGNSTEHDASIHSYVNVIENYVSEKKLDIIKMVIYINGDRIFVYKQNFPKTEKELKNTKSKPLGSLVGELSREIYWFSLLHGNEGEDGAYQGMAEIFNINGSFGDLLPSCLSMNKWVMAEIAQAVTKKKVNIIPCIKLSTESTKADIAEFFKKHPSAEYVVKPNRLGASLFTKKLKKEDIFSFFKSEEFKSILNYDKDILLQKYIKGREFTLGILQINENLVELPVVEIFTNDNFLGHKEKHKRGFVKVTFNKVEKNLKKRMIDSSQLIFNSLRFSNFCRFDYLLSDNKIYLLELNSIPGIMKCSIFTRMLKEANMTIPEMIEIFSNNSSHKVVKEYRYEIE